MIIDIYDLRFLINFKNYIKMFLYIKIFIIIISPIHNYLNKIDQYYHHYLKSNLLLVDLFNFDRY